MFPLGGLSVLRDVTLSVAAHEIVAVAGPNGSGKTTLLRTLVALTPFQQGQVRLFGTPIRQFREWHRVGYVPQHAALKIQSTTAQEVVTSGRLAHHRLLRRANKTDRKIVAEALERVHLNDRARWPFAPLSGGQKQRALLARALATQPELLVMDEPFAGVDLDTQAALTQLLGELRDKGLGVIVVLHELEAMTRVIDRTIQMRDGQAVTPANTRDPRPSPSGSFPTDPSGPPGGKQ